MNIMIATKYTYRVLITESHLDTFGHVNNAIYLKLFEEARWDLLTNNHYGLERIQSSQMGPTVLEITLKFMKELRLREAIVIESQIRSYEGKIAILSQKMLRDGELCCDAEFVMGFFDMKARKLILPTPEWLTAIGLCEQA
ncbi:MAG: thioesterase [Legionella sp.]|nr:MAG: thioesterase [Legionella sp.]